LGGRPRGRSAASSPSRRAVFSTHASGPYGVPRWTQRRPLAGVVCCLVTSKGCRCHCRTPLAGVVERRFQESLVYKHRPTPASGVVARRIPRTAFWLLNVAPPRQAGWRPALANAADSRTDIWGSCPLFRTDPYPISTMIQASGGTVSWGAIIRALLWLVIHCSEFRCNRCMRRRIVASRVARFATQ
jgi:hypothetical protein